MLQWWVQNVYAEERYTEKGEESSRGRLTLASRRNNCSSTGSRRGGETFWRYSRGTSFSGGAPIGGVVYLGEGTEWVGLHWDCTVGYWGIDVGIAEVAERMLALGPTMSLVSRRILLALALLNNPSGTGTSPTPRMDSIVFRESSLSWLKYAAEG